MKKHATLKKRVRVAGDKQDAGIARLVMSYWLEKNPKNVHKFLVRFYSKLMVLALAILTAAAADAAAETKALVSQPEPSKLVSKEPETQKQASKEKEKKKEEKKGLLSLLNTKSTDAVKDAKAKKAKKSILPGVSDEDIKAEGKNFSVRGVVSASNNFGVALEFGNDPKLGIREAWFELNSRTVLSGMKSMSDLEPGDTVQATYKQLKDSPKKILIGLALVSKKPAEIVEAETAPESEPAEDEVAS